MKDAQGLTIECDLDALLEDSSRDAIQVLVIASDTDSWGRRMLRSTLFYGYDPHGHAITSLATRLRRVQGPETLDPVAHWAEGGEAEWRRATKGLRLRERFLLRLLEARRRYRAIVESARLEARVRRMSLSESGFRATPPRPSRRALRRRSPRGSCIPRRGGQAG